MLRWVLVLSLMLACCGGKGAAAGGEKKADLDADPLALLPGSAVVVANLNTRAIFDSGSAGAQLATLASKLVPLGDETGFLARRDVDRIAVAGYATGGADFAAVLSGRFDEARNAAATTANGGAAIVRGVYAGRATYTVGLVQYSILTAKTLVAGSADGLRRLLERVQSGTLDRSMAPWMVETLETKGADMALAADLETQPVAAAAMNTASLSWLKGVRVARVIGNFAPPGMNVAATLTYGDPQLAQSGADGVRVVDGWLNRLGPLLGGVRLQNLVVTPEANDLRCKFAVDDQTLRTAVALASHLLPASQ